jgi:hypothetical protein
VQAKGAQADRIRRSTAADRNQCALNPGFAHSLRILSRHCASSCGSYSPVISTRPNACIGFKGIPLTVAERSGIEPARLALLGHDSSRIRIQ